ncbi:hypothetical protein CAPTEDRAFT_191346 [Capitella teleta]|uniref:CAP-Gly domain-containing protein n=1 Tax=Capitella teleta TaxID=283909 RepID=R7U9P9_CAPTE|nr:hypothetical protein CAPTEDRAFT_191346 [Capitella teleta]|eukprot:ELU02719.1 hypothetical protein CAPTEDRAFT_191346 [Capitella teleta]
MAKMPLFQLMTKEFRGRMVLKAARRFKAAAAAKRMITFNLHCVINLHAENSSQLQSLVVDKELAARAVAFVVSSSRKGIVPLCADVANLLKAKSSPRGQSISAEVQCSLGPADGESTQQINLTLRRDLTNAQQEIAELRQKLLSIELKQKALDECYVENECAKNRNAPSEIARLRSPTFILPPLEGCKCRACEGANCDAALKGGFSCDQTLLCARIQIEVNDTVRLVDGREGRVCYLGHVDKLGSANAIFLGMESTNPESTHDGVHLGERYFTCKHNSGLFAPSEDVDLIISYRQTGKPISRSLSSREERRKTQRKSSFCLSKAAAMETNEVV